LTALGRVGRLGAESEFRRNVDAAERLSILERIKRSIIKLIGSADTLPTEGFLEVKNLFADLKKDWRRPAAVLLRLAIPFGLSALKKEISSLNTLRFLRSTYLHLPRRKS